MPATHHYNFLSAVFFGGSTRYSSDYTAGDADCILLGGAADDMACFDFAEATDFDGDGYDDFILSAPGRDSLYEENGSVYVFYGPMSPLSCLIHGTWSLE